MSQNDLHPSVLAGEEVRCKTCLFYSSEGKHTGRCHRAPPPMSTKYNTLHTSPRISGDSWCGEWRDREPPAQVKEEEGVVRRNEELGIHEVLLDGAWIEVRL